MPFELSVTVKNDDKRMTTKHLIYEPCMISEDDLIIKAAISDAVREFGDSDNESLDIKVKISMEIQ